MKIMLVLQDLVGGGAERVAVVLANEFRNKGHKVIFASDKKWDDAPFVYPISDSVKMVKYFDSTLYETTGDTSFKSHRVYKIIKKLLQYAKSYLILRKVIRNEQPDFVLAFMHPTFLNSFAASIGTKSIVIATEHNAFERPSGVSMGGRNIFFKFFATRLFKAVTILTEADRRVIGNRLRNIHVMPNPLAFKPISLQALSLKRKKQIVAAGRMDVWHYKGFDILIQAWGNIAESHKGWTLNIAGEGSEASLNFLKGVVKDCHVEDSVIFSGFHTDLDMLFHESEIFVLSSRYEGFGMVLIEAMSQGCACIACDYKGRQREIIRSEKEGLCIEPENIDQLAEAMSHMIKDETYRNSIRYHGLLRSKAYDASVIAERWEELFREIQK